MINSLKELIGSVPNDRGFRRRMRVHQGWWRAFVLGEKVGRKPNSKDESVCNTIDGGEETKKNFLNRRVINTVKKVLIDRSGKDPGLIDKDRLFNNLLSSQPLCFNFFSELKDNKELALKIVRGFIRGITSVEDVMFEFAPAERYTDDNSAFDVAIEINSGNKNGLLGLECKYTDTFSQDEYGNGDKHEHIYKSIFNKSTSFSKGYSDYVAKKFNQLFRNQLLAEALVQNGQYDFVITGLFCHKDDKSGNDIGFEFQSMLRNGDNAFKIITYQDFIEETQMLDLDWDTREWTMLLWARYCATKLSEEITRQT